VKLVMWMIPVCFTTFLWVKGELGPYIMPHFHNGMIRVVVMPHVRSMTYLDEQTLDPACFWNGTIEELWKEPGAKERISGSLFSFIYCL
jgi:hypothetical protein